MNKNLINSIVKTYCVFLFFFTLNKRKSRTVCVRKGVVTATSNSIFYRETQSSSPRVFDIFIFYEFIILGYVVKISISYLCRCHLPLDGFKVHPALRSVNNTLSLLVVTSLLRSITGLGGGRVREWEKKIKIISVFIYRELFKTRYSYFILNKGNYFLLLYSERL